MKRLFVIFSLALAFTQYAMGEDDGVKLVYPTAATAEPLDDATAPRRAIPPVKETEETDAETPIGQIRGILSSLRSVENNQSNIADEVGKLEANNGEILKSLETLTKIDPTAATNNQKTIIEDLLKAKDERRKLAEAVAAILQGQTESAGKFEEIKDRIKETIENIPTNKTRIITDLIVYIVLFLVLSQIVARFINAIVEKFKAETKRREEEITAKAYAAIEERYKKEQAKT